MGCAMAGRLDYQIEFGDTKKDYELIEDAFNRVRLALSEGYSTVTIKLVRAEEPEEPV